MNLSRYSPAIRNTLRIDSRENPLALTDFVLISLYPLSLIWAITPGKSPVKQALSGGYTPGKRGKDRKLRRPPHGAIVYPCKASQSPLLRPRPGISPRHSHMAYGSSIAPGPGGLFRPRPYWLALPPPIHGPPPGGVSPMAGAYGGQYTGAGVHGAAWRGRRVHESGGRIGLSRYRVLCRGPPPWGRSLCRLPGPPGRSRRGAVPMPGTGGYRRGITPFGRAHHITPLYTLQIKIKMPKNRQK